MVVGRVNVLPSMTYFLGLDIGTTSTKANAFDLEGRMLCEAHQGYELAEPEPGAATQRMADIVAAAEEVLAKVVGQMEGPPASIGLSTAMHSLLLVDPSGACLSPVYTWADTRAKEVAATLVRTELGQQLFRETGTPIHAMSPLVKIKWLQQSEPDLLAQTARFVGLKSYLIYQWFGVWYLDQSLASATGMYDIRKRCWHPAALDYLNITAEQLPEVVDPLTILTDWKGELPSRLGVDCSTPLAIGISDGCAANLGAGVLGPPQAVLTIGTSAAIRMTSRVPRVDSEQRLFTYILQGDYYVTGGASNNGGKVLEWYCRHFLPQYSFSEILDLAASVAPGAEGLQCLPYVYGERAPVYRSDATAEFRGMRSQHRPAHFVRALLEGMLYNLCLSMESLAQTVAPINAIYANGGFTRSAFWVQLLADIAGLPVHIARTPQASSYGAALVGCRSIGAIPDWSDLDLQPQSDACFDPDPERSETYQQLRKRWGQTFFD